MNMNYNPNFSDPRVQRRAANALGFACGVMSAAKPHAWSTRYIDRYFGKSSNELSKYLRQLLLICTDDFYRFNSADNKCKEYVLNTQGVKYLQEQLNACNIHTYPSVIDLAADEFQEELASGKFVYKDQSQRLWHPLQRYRREHKSQILAREGYEYQYDIQCCAPTLIHQYAQQLGMDQYLFALNTYLSDRQTIRNRLAQELDLPPAAVKELINALFAGAVISKNSKSDIFHILNGDLARIEFLQQHEYILQLKSDIHECWLAITPVLSRRRNLKNRLLPVRSKDKWNVYFELERRVLNAVRTYLIDQDIRHFLEHDGWNCVREIDSMELIDFVKEKTGYVIKLESERIQNLTIHNIP